MSTPLPDLDEQRQAAADMHLAGTQMSIIADSLGVTLTEAKKLVKDGLSDRIGDERLALQVQTEIARIDVMIANHWTLANEAPRAEDRSNAVDRILKLQERRAKLATPKVNRHANRKAFDDVVAKSAVIKDIDAGVVQLGRTYADRMDEAIATAEGYELVKAMNNVGPQLMGVYKQLLATPAARVEADKGKPAGEPTERGKLKHLRSVERQQRA